MKSFTRMVLFLCLALIGVACENPVQPGAELHEHADGVQLLGDGEVLVSVDDDGVHGTLTVAATGETVALQVIFVDHHGDPIEPDAESYLEVVIDDAEIVVFEQDVPGEFGGRLRGLSAGATTVEFRLMHGAVGHGHADAVFGGIPVTVLEP